jgi:small-conductance mechanosensitive channel
MRAMLSAMVNTRYLGNSLLDYAVSAAILAGGLLAVRLANALLLSRFKARTADRATPLEDFLASVLSRTVPPLVYFGVFYLSLQGLALNPAIHRLTAAVGAVLLTYLGINFLRDAVRFLLFGFWLKRHQDDAVERQVRGLMPVITVVLWALGLVFLLDNLGFQVSAVVAGLGIGGVAVALAAQAVLGDLFSYFAIMMDRPFELGDFIIVGDFMGTVEHIGIKTTRLRSLGGEQLVLSNSDLTGSRVRNYKRMQTRRIIFKLGLTYDTPLEKLKEVPGLVKSVIERTDRTRFDRAHFASYGDSSLVVEAVYFVLSADYNVYMDVQQAINFALKQEFEQRGLQFAFPTQTLFVHAENPAPAK